MKNFLLGIAAISIFLSFASIQVSLVLSFVCLVITALTFRELLIELESPGQTNSSALTISSPEESLEISTEEINWNSMAKNLIADKSHEINNEEDLLEYIEEIELSQTDEIEIENSWAQIVSLKKPEDGVSFSSLQSLEASLMGLDLNRDDTLLVTDLDFGQESHLSLASLIKKRVPFSKVICTKIFGRADLIPLIGNLQNIGLQEITKFFQELESKYANVYFILSESQYIQWEAVVRRLNSTRLVEEVKIQDAPRPFA